MKLITIAVFITLAIGAKSQTAKVIVLSSEDAKMAQQLDEEQKALTKRANDFHERVRMKYIGGYPFGAQLTFCLGSGDCNPIKYDWKESKPGWENGFEFSDDWKYIVPIMIQPYKIPSPSFGCNTLTFTPAMLY